MNEKPAIDTHRFDETFIVPKPKMIWTLAAIGQRINCSEDFVRDTLAKLPGSPVQQIGRRWCAVDDDLMAFMRDKDRMQNQCR